MSGVVRGVLRGVTRWCCVGALLLMAAMSTPLATPLGAQVDPRGAVRTLRTQHLRVHYPVALDSLARVAAVYAETAYEQLARELVAPAGTIDLLLTDNVDVANGYAQVFPSNRVVVYAVPPIASRELRYSGDWLRLVITHELAHVFHIDRARGLWRVGRAVFGRNPLFFPNALTPSWVKEGLAVHYESALTGQGRGLSTEFPVLLRAAVRDSAVVPLGRWSLATTRFPRGQTAYGYGTLLMNRSATVAERAPGDSLGMRRYVDATAAHLIPFRLNRNARVGFGASFNSIFGVMRDSALGTPMDKRGDDAWQRVNDEGFYASSPRWLGNDSLVWSASNGREVTGVYVARVPEVGGVAGRARRVAWRNGLDVNVPVASTAGVRGGDVELVFAQPERKDPYVVRQDLYVRRGGAERRLTYGARLTQPDVRADGSIVAVQLGANSSRLVRVSNDGQVITPLTQFRAGELWAEPRWSPAGDAIGAVQLLAGGVQRIVVLDAAGELRHAVAGARGVFASPSFTPNGQRLVWASDRSGRMQLETAALSQDVVPDTLRWQDERAEVRQVSDVSTGVYEPSVSPDGARVVALVQRVEGSFVAWAPLDTTGPIARNVWYAGRVVRAPARDDSATVVSQRATGYSASRLLWPRYWMLLVGEGRLGGATYGITTSGVDILERHAWNASVLIEPTTREVDGGIAYRYAGLGVPVTDLSFTQEWDGTFVVRNDSGARLGLVARKRRFLTVSSTWSVPRVRRAVSATLGAQYEMRDFTADADSILGPANSAVRLGTRYPSFFLNTAFSSARLALKGVSIEEGLTLSTSTSYRWRDDQTDVGSWRAVVQGRGYLPLPLPGYARHVLATRASVGVADLKTQSEFSVGGTSGLSAELIPGVRVGDPSRTFPLRGTAPGVQRGTRAVSTGVEYRAPLVMFSRVPSPLTVYTDRVSFTVFSDAARAWCPALLRSNTVLCMPNGVRDGWIATAGAELVLDMALQYDAPYRVRVGAAAPYAGPADVPRRGAFYVTLGGYF